ncbi:MAG: bifunctional adenosylcobinamide kinase/adenosylcobinamide-phosphate guanylyltransferase [Pseudomonadota bacterium]
MSISYLILGGARSGKSRRALALAESIGSTRVFIATAEAWDDEMEERIARHQDERGFGWSTREVPLDLAGELSRLEAQTDVCVVDCLTLWLSNLMHHGHDVDRETEKLCEVVSAIRIPIILVSNEVGLGIVPETRLGRAFRDAQGRLNQALARVCDRVELIAAGLPLTLKG